MSTGLNRYNFEMLKSNLYTHFGSMAKGSLNNCRRVSIKIQNNMFDVHRTQKCT